MPFTALLAPSCLRRGLGGPDEAAVGKVLGKVIGSDSALDFLSVASEQKIQRVALCKSFRLERDLKFAVAS